MVRPTKREPQEGLGLGRAAHARSRRAEDTEPFYFCLLKKGGFPTPYDEAIYARWVGRSVLDATGQNLKLEWR